MAGKFSGVDRGRWWIPLVLLLVSVLIFWVLPYQQPAPPIKVEFTGDNAHQK